MPCKPANNIIFSLIGAFVRPGLIYTRLEGGLVGHFFFWQDTLIGHQRDL